MATSCVKYAITGMGQECAGSAAGIKRLFIGLDREWVVTENSGGTHSATITAATGATNPKFYDYFIMDESTSLVSTLNVNNQSGVRYYSNVINATWVRMRPEKHLELMALANEKLIVIAQDNNDEYWVLTNVNATAETAQSGQASDDLSGYNVELTGRSPKLPYSIAYADLPTIDTPEVYED